MGHGVVFKPLVVSNVVIPEKFDDMVFTSISDYEVQKKPGVWFTRNHNLSLFYGSNHLKAVNTKSPVFNGAFEVTVPKGYFKRKTHIELTLSGIGFISVKVIESTITTGGVSTMSSGLWKKLDTVRETELILLSRKTHIRTLALDNMWNKPTNVAFNAFLRGFKPLVKENITSLEITIRVGEITFEKVRILNLGN